MDLHQYQLVLDGGTGNGDVAAFMTKRGLHIRGIDLLDRHVRRSQNDLKNLGLMANIRQGSYEDLKFKEDTFDGYILWRPWYMLQILIRL